MFGAAKEDIAKFHKYWRDQVFTKRLFPADQALRNAGKAGLLEWSIVGGYGRVQMEVLKSLQVRIPIYTTIT